ncbi:LYAM3 protein, partial [Atractosteus spatula]|nr:LYAM3 protein [Atractosteus spatula]
MVAIQNKAEIEYLNEVLPKQKKYYWIGIRKREGVWTWVGTNKTLTTEAENWAKGEPNNKKTAEDCVEIYIKREKDEGKWNDEDCKRSKTALCYTASCQPFSCANGECIETINNHTCKCYDGFYGEKCEHAVACDSVQSPSNGFINCSHPFGNFFYKSTCEFGCENGYRPNATTTIHCTASKQWSSDPPVCKAVQCGALAIPSKGSMNCVHPLGNFSFGSACEFACEKGYRLTSSDTLACTASGQWNDSQPQCEAVQCSRLEEPSNGFINCSHPFGNFFYKSTCEFGCENGYRPNATTTIHCTASKQWSSDPPVCKAVQCGALAIPSKGSMNCVHPLGNFSFGSACEFACEKGYRLTSSDTLACTASGQWNDSQPQCEAVQCSRLEEPSNGNMTCSHPNGEFSYSSLCQFSCAEGFVLKGSPTIMCTASTQWTAEAPHCEGPGTVAHGAVVCSDPADSLGYNSSCQFSCDPGFVLEGADSLQCTSPGQWTAQPPVCTEQPQSLRIYTAISVAGSVSALSGLSLAAWIVKRLQKKAVQCGALTKPVHGYINCSEPYGSNSFNSTCQFHCLDGFSLNGSNSITCTSSGNWTGAAPTCQGVECELQSHPDNGVIQCSGLYGNHSFNSTCEFHCIDGFLLLGPTTITCGPSGIWTGRKPICAASCTESSCSPWGECVETIGSYTCQCFEGFEGPHCEAVGCEVLQPPAYGTMNCTHIFKPFHFNSTCVFQCAQGYELRGSQHLRCQASGAWTADTPACQAVKCEVLTTPSHGIMDCEHPIAPFSYSSSCRLGCEEGFLLNGSNSTQCTAQGLWTETTQNCQALKCTTLQTPQHSTMNCSHPYGEFSFNSSCEIVCEEGFLLSGANFIQCTSQGQWTDSTPVCQAHECAPLRAPDRGLMNCSHPHGEFRFGSRCELDCEEGFVLRGSNTLQCTASGLWTHKLPSCQAVKCEELTAPSHGIMDCQHPIENFSYTSSCRLGCAEGFLLNGANVTQCTSQGLWTERIPVCQAHECGPLRAPDRGLMNCSHPHEEFRFGSRCELDCEEGFVLRGSNTLQCTASGLWTHTLPTCQAVKCEELAAPSHGIMDCQHPIENFSYTSSCRLGCAEGFLLNGANVTQCTSQGLWTERIPVCQAHKCTSLRAPQHSAMNCSHPYGEFSFNSSCEIDCEEGFLLRGANFIQCTSQGQWTDSTPVCQAHECAPLRAPDRGLMNCSHPHEEFRFGSRCELDCEEGFVLRGSNTLQCTASGLWTHTLPSCQAVKCEELAAPSHGIMDCQHPIENFSYTSSCRLGCAEGFLLNGANVTQCTSQGLWTERIPVCQAHKCTSLRVPQHSAMNCSHPYGEFSFNSSCEIDCEEGFLLNGANFIQCTSQGQWTDSTPVCQAHECAPLRAPDRGLMNCSHPHEEFRFGSRCELDCEEGFVLRGSNTLQCTASGLWTHTLPSCQGEFIQHSDSLWTATVS